MDEILLIPVPENKRPSYWNSISGLQSSHTECFRMGNTNVRRTVYEKVLYSTLHRNGTRCSTV